MRHTKVGANLSVELNNLIKGVQFMTLHYLKKEFTMLDTFEIFLQWVSYHENCLNSIQVEQQIHSVFLFFL